MTTAKCQRVGSYTWAEKFKALAISNSHTQAYHSSSSKISFGYRPPAKPHEPEKWLLIRFCTSASKWLKPCKAKSACTFWLLLHRIDYCLRQLTNVQQMDVRQCRKCGWRKHDTQIRAISTNHYLQLVYITTITHSQRGSPWRQTSALHGGTMELTSPRVPQCSRPIHSSNPKVPRPR